MRLPRADATEQRDRFIEAARKLGCDEDEAALEEKKLAKRRPKPEPKIG